MILSRAAMDTQSSRLPFACHGLHIFPDPPRLQVFWITYVMDYTFFLLVLIFFFLTTAVTGYD